MAEATDQPAEPSSPSSQIYLDIGDIQVIEPVLPRESSVISGEAEKRDFEQEAREVELEGRKQDIGERKKYAKLVFWLICAWLLLLFAVLALQGFNSRTGFLVSDKVLITLVTGTTANVLGIFFVVMNYLFPKK